MHKYFFININNACCCIRQLIVEELRAMIVQDEDIPNTTRINAIILDHYLWDYRREHATETSHIPIHKIRCIYY